MIIWYMSAYDQPLGKSSRTYDFSIQLSNMGHEVTMFTNSYCHWTHIDILGSKERSKIEEINGIKVVWLKTYPYSGNGLKRGINMITNVFRSLQVEKTINQKPDIIIGPSVPIGTGWAAFRIAKKYNIPFVYEVRDVWPISLVENGGLSKNNPIYFIFRLIEKTLYKQSVKISSTLRFLQKHVKESGSDPEKIEWIPNGVDFSRFNNCAKYNGGDKNTINVMYIGGFGQAHDVITLVKCAKLFHDKKDIRFNFIVIGDGPEFKKIKSLSGDNVTLMGYQSFDVLKEHLAKAKAFIFAAEEDFGIAPLEAQAAGTPVIAFGKGGALETVQGLDSPTPSGIFFEYQTIESLRLAIEEFEGKLCEITSDNCITNSQRFSDERFRLEFKSFIDNTYNKWRNNL